MALTHGAEITLWISLGALLYAHAGYPLLLAIRARLAPRTVQRREWTPTVSVIITAYNEERDLAAKLQNTLELAYPRDKIEVIVASDCSTDRTDEIARMFAPSGVRLCRRPQRRGKTAAQNAAVEQARGEILLFSDATTLYPPDVLRVMLPNFADPTVGCVAGKLVYDDPWRTNIGSGTRLYWGYESFLKKCESLAGSLIGVSGCLYAVRRACYLPLPPDTCSDFVIALNMVKQGVRAVYEPRAVCVEQTNRLAAKELRMRVRIITQTFNDLWRHRAMMNPFCGGFFAVQLLSHKVLRYLMPFFLCASFVSALPLARASMFSAAVVGGQLWLYGLAAAAWTLERLGKRNRWFALPHYFVLTNIAAVIALYEFLRGERYVHWEPIREPVAGAPIATQAIPSPSNNLAA